MVFQSKWHCHMLHKSSSSRNIYHQNDPKLFAEAPSKPALTSPLSLSNDTGIRLFLCTLGWWGRWRRLCGLESIRACAGLVGQSPGLGGCAGLIKWCARLVCGCAVLINWHTGSGNRPRCLYWFWCRYQFWCWYWFWCRCRCRCRRSTKYVNERVRSLVLQQVLGIDLVLLKHNIDRRVHDVVHAAVKEVYVPAILGRRPAVVGGPSGVVSHQQSWDEHGFDIRVTGVVVGVFCIPGKVTTWVWTKKDFKFLDYCNVKMLQKGARAATNNYLITD